MQISSSIILSFNFGQYPFGMLAVGRNWEVGSNEGYRFGFNGAENDDAIKGDDNSVNFGDRIYDPRIGRWLKLDDFAYLYAPNSPYSFALNKPIILIDPTGSTIYDSQGNEVIITFNEETNEIASITGTTDEELIQAIKDTWNESETGKTTITDLNSQDVKVQVVLRDKIGYYQNANGELEPVNGLTCSFSNDEGKTHFFTDENGITYNFRVYLFNTTASPELTPSGVDIIGQDLMPLTEVEIKDAIEEHQKITARKEKKAKKHPVDPPNFYKGLDPQEILILFANDELMKTDKGFGRVSVLIHENVHLQDKQQNRKGDGELSPWRAQIKSFIESGKEYMKSKEK